MRKIGYFTPNRDHGYNVLRAQVELKQWQEANDELAPAKFRFRAYEKCFLNTVAKATSFLRADVLFPKKNMR